VKYSSFPSGGGVSLFLICLFFAECQGLDLLTVGRKCRVDK
jgi:hypothetical protein